MLLPSGSTLSMPLSIIGSLSLRFTRGFGTMLLRGGPFTLRPPLRKGLALALSVSIGMLTTGETWFYETGHEPDAPPVHRAYRTKRRPRSEPPEPPALKEL